jgi:hypothetical protein
MSRGFSLKRWLVNVQDESWAMMCSFTYKWQNMNEHYHISQAEARIHRNWSIYVSSSHLHFHSLFLLDYTHRHHPEVSQHHTTCKHHYFVFQTTPDNLYIIVHCLLASFCDMQWYHNVNASHVDLSSTHSDLTKGQPQRTGKGNSQGKNANIHYK